MLLQLHYYNFRCKQRMTYVARVINTGDFPRGVPTEDRDFPGDIPTDDTERWRQFNCIGTSIQNLMKWTFLIWKPIEAVMGQESDWSSFQPIRIEHKWHGQAIYLILLFIFTLQWAPTMNYINCTAYTYILLKDHINFLITQVLNNDNDSYHWVHPCNQSESRLANNMQK